MGSASIILGGFKGETAPEMRARGTDWWDNWARLDSSYSPAHYDAQLAAALTSAGDRDAANEIRYLAGLLHDLGKYSVAFQRRLEGGDKVDHATAGAQEILKLAQTNQDRVVARIIAHAIAGHHAGLPDSIGELDQRLKKAIAALDPVWCDEINPDTKGLTPSGFDWGNKDTCAFRLAFLGRMLFSCLVEADFRDIEQFYCKAE